MYTVLFEKGDYMVAETELGFTVFLERNLELDSYKTLDEAKARVGELTA